MEEKIASLFTLDYQPGDLVRLAEDHDLEFGVGLVQIVRRDLEDIYDVLQLFKILHDMRTDEVFPSKPQLFIMWSNGKSKKSVPGDSQKSLWMYPTDVVLYKRLKRD